ncbi:hypothetical protein K4B79_12375 [Streptomyces lincolnensis]|uniref:hypothetical protein n=1 Tax=Streptomyces lincolnensis TaxID=1915 RepID=UPI001E327370|nr:hypothetical protein [Streptomyces lincolnensis]MCD7439021.1 hypothetical protein [Streptomyces lincolnensis]
MGVDEQAMRDEFERREKKRSEAYSEMIAVVGRVAQASARLELQLRQLMQTLLDSKYARLVAAGLAAGELIDTCTVLLRVNKEISEDQRTEGLDLLAGLKEVLGVRNNLVHGLIAMSGSGLHDLEAPEPVVETIALVSKRRKPELMVTVTVADAEKTIEDLHKRADGILRWVATYLPGPLNREQVVS